MLNITADLAVRDPYQDVALELFVFRDHRVDLLGRDLQVLRLALLQRRVERLEAGFERLHLVLREFHRRDVERDIRRELVDVVLDRKVGRQRHADKQHQEEDHQREAAPKETAPPFGAIVLELSAINGRLLGRRRRVESRVGDGEGHGSNFYGNGRSVSDKIA